MAAESVASPDRPVRQIPVLQGLTLDRATDGKQGAMGLERVHRANNTEHFGPVRLGPQDLRDVAAVFDELDSKADLPLPEFRTEINTGEHKTGNIKDVLAFADSDTLPSIHLLSGGLRLSFHVSRGQTTITKPFARVRADDQAVTEEAAEKLRQIIWSRQLGPLQSLRQRGPGKWPLVALFAFPALLLLGGQTVLDLWLTRVASQAVTAGLVWLCFLVLLLLSGRPKDPVRLRGQDLPWWERRQGLIALLGLVTAVVIPIVVFGLESAQK